MSELTDLILKKHDAEKETERQFLRKIGVTSQKFYNWKKGAVPEDKVLFKISEILNIDFLTLVSAARATDAGSDAGTRNEWRKIFNNRKAEMSSKKRAERLLFSANITGSLE